MSEMIYRDFTYQEYGFVGHMACPNTPTKKAVIVVMGGEKSIFPGIKIAERFADYGFCGLSVSLFGASGIPETVNQIPLEMFGKAIELLQELGYEHISMYGMSMGSIFASFAPIYFKGIENVILVSPTHVPFEGTDQKKKHMSGRSVVTYQGEDLNFVKADFTKYQPSKYIRTSSASYPVMGMWQSYYDAYQDHDKELEAMIPYEKMNANLLMVAGECDEAWPSSYSVKKIKDYLTAKAYDKKVKAIIYPKVGHLTGMMPSAEREKKLYKLIPLIGFVYKTLGKYKKENLEAFDKAEKEIIAFLHD